ncbi:MAG: hypothetical protein MUC98_16975, partial [Desulfobacterota bacterium]|nr:hypothetical protein [Thermodesulfobacteriota bacterium]
FFLDSGFRRNDTTAVFLVVLQQHQFTIPPKECKKICSNSKYPLSPLYQRGERIFVSPFCKGGGRGILRRK